MTPRPPLNEFSLIVILPTTMLVSPPSSFIFKLVISQVCPGSQEWAQKSRQWNHEHCVGGWLNHDLSHFPKGPDFHFVRIKQILYGFCTSWHHESNNVVHFFIIGLQFSGTFNYGGIRVKLCIDAYTFILFSTYERGPPH